MSPKRNYFINAVKLIPIDGAPTTPTAIFYSDGRSIIGSEAYAQIDQPGETNLRDDFNLCLWTI